MNARVAPLDGERHPAMLEAQRRVAAQRAGQQAGFGEHLEAVADAQREPAARGMVAHGAHDRAEARDRARHAGSRRARSRPARMTASAPCRSVSCVPHELSLRACQTAPRAARRGRSSSPERRRRRPSCAGLDRPALDQRVRQELVGQRGHRRARKRLALGARPSARPAARRARRGRCRRAAAAGRPRPPCPADRGCRRAA